MDPELGGLVDHVTGVEAVRAAALEVLPEAVAEHCGVTAHQIRALARRYRRGTADRGLRAYRDVHGHVRHPHQLAGGRDQPADRQPRPARRRDVPHLADRVGAAPTEAGAGLLRRAVEQPGVRPSRGCARVADRAVARGDRNRRRGQIKAVVTIAGNPVLSAPDGDRLSAALDRLDFMVSIDPYSTETTRHADVILPPPPPSYTPHFDILLSGVAVRSNARYSPPVFPAPAGTPDEATIVCRLIPVSSVWGIDADPGLVDRQIISAVLGKEVADPTSPVVGRDADELAAMLIDGPGYERRLDMMLRLGPFGDAFGAQPDGLTMPRLKDNPHGIDLGSDDAAHPRGSPNPRAESNWPPR